MPVKKLSIRKIGQMMFFNPKPVWLKGHDHLVSIPFTNSFVFYPYNDDQADEKELNEYYNKFGYTVIRRPKFENEYTYTSPQLTWKVLILEPNYDERKIDEGCNMVATFFRNYWEKNGAKLPEQ